jgi:hypothetical protein
MHLVKYLVNNDHFNPWLVEHEMTVADVNSVLSDSVPDFQ